MAKIDKNMIETTHNLAAVVEILGEEMPVRKAIRYMMNKKGWTIDTIRVMFETYGGSIPLSQIAAVSKERGVRRKKKEIKEGMCSACGAEPILPGFRFLGSNCWNKTGGIDTHAVRLLKGGTFK